MDPVTEQWFARRTYQEPTWRVDELVAAKAGRRVSVVLPALDEEATVGAIVAAIVPLTRGPAPLVDELVVMDSGSADRTTTVAAAAGARVVLRTDVVAHLPPVPGKGEVLWRSLAATTGDIICYLDSDLVDFDPAFVPALLGPLLTEPHVGLVKGFYRRPLRLETHAVRHRGRAGHRAAGAAAAGRAAPRARGHRPAAGRGVRRDQGAAGVRALRGRATAWRSGCCSTPGRPWVSTGWPRSTWGCASTATGRCCSWA